MLEFIVLGEIPGTQLQLNVTDVLLMSAWILVFLEAFILIQRRRHQVKLAHRKSAARKRPIAKSKAQVKKTTKKTSVKISSKSKLAQA